MSAAVFALVAATGLSPSFDARLAETLMSLNTATLCPIADISAWNCSRCNSTLTSAQDVTVVNASLGATADLAAIVAVVPTLRAVVVAIRGTVATSIMDWLIDAEAWQVAWAPQGSAAGFNHSQVHHGFAAAHKALSPGLHSALEATLARPDTAGFQLIFSGHSLGASICTLFATEYLVAGKTPSSIFTYGEPRTGNLNFSTAATEIARHAGVPVWRIVNKRDVVPHLPPANSIAWRYQHISTEVLAHPPFISSERLFYSPSSLLM